MPLSKCRRCGKYVPNIFRPYHEKVACLELKRQRGDLNHKDLPRVRKPKPAKPLVEGQRRLMEFHEFG